MLCEKISLKIASQSIIDEIALKCQKLLKKAPLYTQLENSKDNSKIKDSDDEMLEFLNIDDKENSVEISLWKHKPGLFDIKNRKLNKHQDFSLFMLI